MDEEETSPQQADGGEAEQETNEFDGLKRIGQTPSLEKMQSIPVGKCVIMKTDIGEGRIEEVEVCRRSNDEWDIAGPKIKSHVALKEMPMRDD